MTKRFPLYADAGQILFSRSQFVVASAAAVAIIGLSLCAVLPAHAQDLLVGEYFSDTIWRVAPDGSKTTYISLPTGGLRLCGIVQGQDGSLYAAQFAIFAGTGAITRVAPGGTSFTFFAPNIPGSTQSVAIDSAGNVYAGGDGTAQVRRYSPSGADLGVFATVSGTDTSALAMDSAGNLYVGTETNGQIRRFSPSGSDLGTFATSTNLRSLAFDGAGNLFVGTANGTIERFSSSGASLGTFATLAGANFQSLAFAANGELYAGNYAQSTIQRYSATGASLGTFSSGITSPLGMTFLKSATTTVPEQGTLTLLEAGLSMGLIGAVGVARRRRHSRC